MVHQHLRDRPARRVFATAGLVTLLVVSGAACFGAEPPPLKSGEIPLSEEVKTVAGEWHYSRDTISIAGRIYDGCGLTWHPSFGPRDRGFATFDVRGWDRFQAWLGIDDKWTPETAATVSIEVDGEQVAQVKVRYGQKAVPVDVALTGRQALTIRREGSVAVAAPKLIKGKTAAIAPPTESQPPRAEPAPFAVDPNDLDKLAGLLRKSADANPTMAERLRAGNVALSTFVLVDIPSQAVAQNVAEDLYTALIRTGFGLVERGQLDKVLQELKIQHAGLIDPATAQKIGQLSGCDVILLGSISDRGTFVVVNARLMDTATGRSLVAERVEMRKIPIGREG